MLEYQHVILTKGQYNLVALTHSEVYAPGEVVGYAVVTASGARLTEDLSLDDARTWLESFGAESGGGGGADRDLERCSVLKGRRR